MKRLAQHLLIELFGCDKVLLDDPVLVGEGLESAVREADATIVKTVLHRFSPHGVSGVVLIAESHVAIHTWPEYGYAAVDVFTCSETVDPDRIMKSLARRFSARECESRLIERGLPLESGRSEVVPM